MAAVTQPLAWLNGLRKVVGTSDHLKCRVSTYAVQTSGSQTWADASRIGAEVHFTPGISDGTITIATAMVSAMSLGDDVGIQVVGTETATITVQAGTTMIKSGGAGVDGGSVTADGDAAYVLIKKDSSGRIVVSGNCGDVT